LMYCARLGQVARSIMAVGKPERLRPVALAPLGAATRKRATAVATRRKRPEDERKVMVVNGMLKDEREWLFFFGRERVERERDDDEEEVNKKTNKTERYERRKN